MHYTTFGDRIEITLPITTPTGKVRVKRPVPGHAPEPVACRTVPMAEGDYLEWQISYDTDSLQGPSVLRDVILNKPKGVRYGCELVRLVVEARKIDMLQDDEFERLKGITLSTLQHGIEETEQIIRESGPQPKNLAKSVSRHGILKDMSASAPGRYSMKAGSACLFYYAPIFFDQSIEK